jgi:cobalt-zinc-cadmium efflux system outer membrane protein
MKKLLLMLLVCAQGASGAAVQQTAGDTVSPSLKLDDALREAIEHNPAILASVSEVHRSRARSGRASSLVDPELTYMREEMPGFRFHAAMMERIEFMQMIRFPSKLSTQGSLAGIQVDRAIQRHRQTVIDMLTKVSLGFYGLWDTQQNILLNRDHEMLIRQFIRIAQQKYAVNMATQSEVLMAQVELARLINEQTILRGSEEGEKRRLMALLDRPPDDTLGTVLLPDTVDEVPSLDSLLGRAVSFHPSLLNDSLSVLEEQTRLALSRQEYIPDLRLGVQYKRFPQRGTDGWGVAVGITLPFAPWTLGSAASRVEEARAGVEQSEQVLSGTRNDILAEVRDLYASVQAARDQLRMYESDILPQGTQALRATLSEYQTNNADFLRLIDAYRTLVSLNRDRTAARTRFERLRSELERAVGGTHLVISDDGGKE